jgi:Family of unknown function (DUF5677)
LSREARAHPVGLKACNLGRRQRRRLVRDTRRVGDRANNLEQVTPELLRASADEFAEMLSERLPLTFPMEVSWKLVATGLLARMSSVFNSMTSLVERGSHADAQVLLRVLYDHAATFCWLGIDPDGHLAEWQRWDHGRYLKLHNDAAAFGVTVLDADDLERFAGSPDPRGLAELAEAIDRYWPDHIAAFRSHPAGGAPKEIRSFRGLYASIFRKTSSLIHATEADLGRHTRVRQGYVLVTLEEQPLKSDIPGVAAALTAFALLVYRHHFGWPEEARAKQMVELLRS